jgi:hypothetical protein
VNLMVLLRRVIRSCLVPRRGSFFAALLAISLLLSTPESGKAQLGIGAVLAAASAVVRLIRNTIGSLFETAIGILGEINSVVQAFANLWQTVVYPLALIARAKAMVTQIIAMFTGLAMSVHNVNVLSATLPNPMALESIVRNRVVTDFAQFEHAFRQTYRPLPRPADIDSGDRERVDLSDAMAMGTLKMLKASDQVIEQTLRAAEIIEAETAQAAPGSAPYLTATGLVAAVENQAMMQRLLAAELRAEAALLANDNAIRKRYVDATAQHRQGTTSAVK